MGSWLDSGEENGSLKLLCMHHKPHSLTGDLGREEGKKYMSIKQVREIRGGVANWIIGKLGGKRVNTLVFYTQFGQYYPGNKHSCNVFCP